MADSVDHIDCWQGWVLLFATKHCYSFVTCKGSKNNPFSRCELAKDLVGKCRDFVLGLGMNMSDYGASLIHCVLDESLKGMLVIDITELSDIDCGDYEVVIVTNSEGRTGLRNLSDAIEGWCLRTIVYGGCWEGTLKDAIVYSRHGGSSGSNWWKRKHSYYMNGRIAVPVEWDDFRDSVFEGQRWDVVVYTKGSSRSNFELRLDYMRCCGFQTRVRCHSHKLPLIVNTKLREVSSVNDSEDVDVHFVHRTVQTREKCLVCDKTTIYYCCSVPSCNVRLCRNHYEELCVDDSLSQYECIHVINERLANGEESEVARCYVMEYQDDIGVNSDDDIATSMFVDGTVEDETDGVSLVDCDEEFLAREEDTTSSSASERNGEVQDGAAFDVNE